LPGAYFICRYRGASHAEWPKDSHEYAPTPTCGVISCPPKTVDTECRPPTVARVSKRPKKLRAISRACPRGSPVRQRRRGGELLPARRTLFQVDVFEQRSYVEGVSERPAEPNPSTSPHPPREPSRTGVDATLALDELVQRLGTRLLHGGVAHDAAPFAPGPFVSLGRVGGAPNDVGECVHANIQELISRMALRLRSTMRRELGSAMVRSHASCVMVRETVSMVSPR
jgi:hypothetical protein